MLQVHAGRGCGVARLGDANGESLVEPERTSGASAPGCELRAVQVHGAAPNPCTAGNIDSTTGDGVVPDDGRVPGWFLNRSLSVWMTLRGWSYKDSRKLRGTLYSEELVLAPLVLALLVPLLCEHSEARSEGLPPRAALEGGTTPLPGRLPESVMLGDLPCTATPVVHACCGRDLRSIVHCGVKARLPSGELPIWPGKLQRAQ